MAFQGHLRAALEKEQELADHIAGFQASSGHSVSNVPPATSPSDSRATYVNNLSVTLSNARTGEWFVVCMVQFDVVCVVAHV